MKKTNLFLFVVLFFASCASPATPEPTRTLTADPIKTLTPTNIPTETPTPTPTITPTPTQIGGGSGRLIFIYTDGEYEKDFPDLNGLRHVFVANLDGTNLQPVTDELEGNYRTNLLKDVSPDGTKALITSAYTWNDKKADLYVADLDSLDAPLFRLARSLPNYPSAGNILSAKWLDDTRVIYIGQGDAGYGIYIINADGTNQTNIERNNPYEILGVSKERVYWSTIVSKQIGNQTWSTWYVWWTSLDGAERGKLLFNDVQIAFHIDTLAFSPDGEKIAWLEPRTPTFLHNYLHISLVSEIDNPQTMNQEPLTSGLYLKWVDDDSVLIFDEGTLQITNRSFDTTSIVYGLYEVSATQDLKIKNHILPPDFKHYYHLYDVSPDGRTILCGSGTTLYLLELETSTFSELPFGIKIGIHGYGSNTVLWIP